MGADWIELRGLRVEARIGVPDEERRQPQQLLLDVRLHPKRQFSEMPDAIEAAVDYAEVAARLEELAQARPRQLIETLADEAATMLLRRFAITRVEITVRKFILPQTEWVAVHCVRERNH